MVMLAISIILLSFKMTFGLLGLCLKIARKHYILLIIGAILCSMFSNKAEAAWGLANNLYHVNNVSVEASNTEQTNVDGYIEDALEGMTKD